MLSNPVTPLPAFTRPVENLMRYYVLKAALTMIAFPLTITLLYFRYHTMRYEFSDQGIRMSWGICPPGTR